MSEPLEDADGWNEADLADALVHGLLFAMQRREGRASLAAPRPRRRWPVAVAASLAAAACVLFAVWPTPATAGSVLDRAIAAHGAGGIRVYELRMAPADDEPRGVAEFEGRLVLEGGPEPRMAARLSAGPGGWPVRLGFDRDGPWLETPLGVSRGDRDAPFLTRILGGLDDRVLRIETLLERCRDGYGIEMEPDSGDGWRIRARRDAAVTGNPIEAEFTIREHDGEVAFATILVEGPLGGRSTLRFTRVDGTPVDAAELEPSRDPAGSR